MEITQRKTMLLDSTFCFNCKLWQETIYTRKATSCILLLQGAGILFKLLLIKQTVMRCVHLFKEGRIFLEVNLGLFRVIFLGWLIKSAYKAQSFIWLVTSYCRERRMPSELLIFLKDTNSKRPILHHFFSYSYCVKF